MSWNALHYSVSPMEFHDVVLIICSWKVISIRLGLYWKTTYWGIRCSRHTLSSWGKRESNTASSCSVG